MLVLGPEEKTNFEFSISNLAALKIFHDVGIDVSNFEEFMMDTSYNDSFGSNIFNQGCKALFTEVTVFSSYESQEEEQILEKFMTDKLIDDVPEYAFEIKDLKMDRILNSPLANEFKETIMRINKEVVDEDLFFSGEIFPTECGFVVAVLSLGQFHELSLATTLIYKEIERLYETLVKDGK